MKIISLTAENIKKLVAVEIRPDGNFVQITGKNAQGKTSVLDSIWWCLAGSSNIQKNPIRNGETTALICLDLGEVVVTRKFKTGADGEVTSSITVESADGAKFSSPQSLLDGFLGQLSFDPLAFSRMDAKKQFDTLKSFVPDVDFDEIETLNKKDYDERTHLNRQAKECQQAAAKIVVNHAPVEKVDESALLAKLTDASKINSEILARKSRREFLAKEIESNFKKAEQIHNEAEELKARSNVLFDQHIDLLSKVEADVKKLENAPPLPEMIDVNQLNNQIQEARRINAQFVNIDQRNKLLEDAKKYSLAAEAFTESIESRNFEKMQVISKANLPVDGLSLGNGFVIYNGVPFDQASDAEQLRVSISIAMASNPKLRVIRVRDGSLLDEAALKLLEQMANEKDYQVWIERVNSSGKVGFVLENGLVKTSNNKSAQPEEQL